MTSEKLYYTISLLVNKNNENSNIAIEKENFVLLYNREALRWLSDYIEANNLTSNIINVSGLLVKDKELDRISTTPEKDCYEIPDNYFKPVHGDFRSETSCGIIYNWMYKPNDVNVILENKVTKPSAVWERGIATVSEEAINVYKEDFTINSTTLSYYRKPREIDLDGYTNENNEPSKNINPDVNDYICNLILDRVATEIKREWVGADFQVAQSRERGF